MSKLKPIGSEKLQGSAKLDRILEIAMYKEVEKSNINESSSNEFGITLPDGKQYFIVKEKSGYIIKKGLNESTLDYIEPMKNRSYYRSYSQALKKLNLITKELNEIYSNHAGLSLFGEQKKYTLKTPRPNVPEPSMDEPLAEPPAVPNPELPPSPLSGGDEMSDMEGMDGEMPDMEGMDGEMPDMEGMDGEMPDMEGMGNEMPEMQPRMNNRRSSNMGNQNRGETYTPRKRFEESKVDSVLSKYFEVSPNEQRLNENLNNAKRFSVSKTQLESVKKFLNENRAFNIVGRTNLDNVVLENKNKKSIRINKNGNIL